MTLTPHTRLTRRRGGGRTRRAAAALARTVKAHPTAIAGTVALGTVLWWMRSRYKKGQKLAESVNELETKITKYKEDCKNHRKNCVNFESWKKNVKSKPDYSYPTLGDVGDEFGIIKTPLKKPWRSSKSDETIIRIEHAYDEVVSNILSRRAYELLRAITQAKLQLQYNGWSGELSTPQKVNRAWAYIWWSNSPVSPLVESVKKHAQSANKQFESSSNTFTDSHAAMLKNLEEQLEKYTELANYIEKKEGSRKLLNYAKEEFDRIRKEGEEAVVKLQARGRGKYVRRPLNATANSAQLVPVIPPKSSNEQYI